MIIEPIKFATFDLVEIKYGIPYCKIHGVMNKMNKHEDGGGIWRCISMVTKQNENACRAGCCEKRENHGICLECNKRPATIDYNKHNHWVCNLCNESLERQFEEDYK